jgi:hypothetical protein
MKNLKIVDITMDVGIQPRFKLDLDLVKEYAEKMRDGENFPPPVVFCDGSHNYLSAGFNRVMALKSNGHVEIECEVINGTFEDAQDYAWKSNNDHGAPLTAEEKREIIRKALKTKKYSESSNNELAKEFKISSMTVSRVRIAMQEESKEAQPKERNYKDKHGNEKTMDTSNIGKKKPKKKPKDKPKQESENEKEYDQSEQKMRELMDTINNIADENTLLRDKIAIGQWDASEIEKIDAQETIANLREHIRVLEIDNQALRESRDMFQNRNAELIKSVNSLKKKLQKGE